MAGAAFRAILGDSRSAKCCIFHTKCVSKMGRVKGLRSGGCEMTFLSSDYVRNVVASFLLAEAIHGVSAEVLNLQT